MGDEDDGFARAAPQIVQVILQPVAGEFVKRGERLIHQQQ